MAFDTPPQKYSTLITLTSEQPALSTYEHTADQRRTMTYQFYCAEISLQNRYLVNQLLGILFLSQKGHDVTRFIFLIQTK